MSYNLITILGATASGKTGFAVQVANLLTGEIISADSRQVYRRMDIGTGKDLSEYNYAGKQIPVHLIDIVEPGTKYNVFEYQKDFIKAFETIQAKNKLPTICGGTGMYLEAVLKGYKLIKVPVNEALRGELEKQEHAVLIERLLSYKKVHNTTDTQNRKRLIRAIEIADYYEQNPEEDSYYPEINSLIVGIKYDRDSRRRRITERLKARLEEGMIDEVRSLIDEGVDTETLIYYGLEYKFLTKYLLNEISYDQMFSGLETAIHQFSKRQMTWFRKMERDGFKIQWLDGYMPDDEKLQKLLIWSEQ